MINIIELFLLFRIQVLLKKKDLPVKYIIRIRNTQGNGNVEYVARKSIYEYFLANRTVVTREGLKQPKYYHDLVLLP